jgi:hypothetical protein
MEQCFKAVYDAYGEEPDIGACYCVLEAVRIPVPESPVL